jgi:hypothetical protein
MSMLWTATYALDRGKACQETWPSRGTWVWYCMLYDIFLESERYNTLKLGITPLKVGFIPRDQFLHLLRWVLYVQEGIIPCFKRIIPSL